MPPKKIPRSPFWFFMAEYRSKEQAKGREFYSLEQVKREAAPHWDKLDQDARGEYVSRAKSYKKDPKYAPEKYTSQGVPLSVVEAEKRELKRKQETIKLSIAELIQTAVCKTELEKMQACLISFNCFCRTSSGIFVPGELAMVRYSLEGGVIDSLHEFINPVKIPLGMAYDAVTVTSDTHQLPLPPKAMGETDFEILLGKIISFMVDKQDDQKCPKFLLFANADEIPMVENILEQFISESQIPFHFLVCPLTDLFYQLKVATEGYGMEIRSFPDRIVAGILLKKDPYEYTAGISCDFHEKLGNTRHCALSRVTRWTYIISDNCCLDVGIDMVPGRHLPANADTTLCSDSSNRTDDKMSFVSSSDMTHISMPKLQKTKSRSSTPPRGSHITGTAAIEDAKGAVIYSSRAGTFKPPKIEKKPTTNPFHDTPQASSSRDIKRYNPFSREKMLEETREPLLETVGHGRGMLLKQAFGSIAGSSRVSSLCAGRGSLLFNPAESSVGTASTIRSSDDEDD